MTPTLPQEQTEREAFEAALASIPACTSTHREFAWLMWQAGRASMQAQAPEVAALQREVEELRKLLIDIRAALPALRDNGVAKLYALAIDNALAASKAEVPNG